MAARQQARLAKCRLAAVRLGDFFPLVTLHINSVQAWRPGGAQGVMIDPSLTIDESIEDVPRRATFRIRDATSSPPQPGQAVYIGLGSADNRIFGGQIISCEQDHPNRYVEPPTFTVRAEDNRRLLNRLKVTARFLSTDAGEIIRQIVSSWSSGFTTTHVNSLGTVDEIEFTKEDVSTAITRTLKRIGGRWYLDGRKDIHAFVGSEAGVSPAADLVTTSKQKAWKHTKDISQVRTRVIVKGGGTVLTERANFSQGSTGPYFISDSTYLVGVSTISVGAGFYPVTSVNNTASPYFFVLPNSLALPLVTQVALAIGTPVNVYAVAESTTLQNSVAAIEGGDGVHEYFITDGRMTQSGALQRAQSELTLFGSIEHRGSYTTRDPSAQAGRLLAINAASPVFISSVAVRIQRVTVSGFEQSGRSWSSTRAHYFPLRQVDYSSGALRDVFEIMGDFERGI